MKSSGAIPFSNPLKSYVIAPQQHIIVAKAKHDENFSLGSSADELETGLAVVRPSNPSSNDDGVIDMRRMNFELKFDNPGENQDSYKKLLA